MGNKCTRRGCCDCRAEPVTRFIARFQIAGSAVGALFTVLFVIVATQQSSKINEFAFLLSCAIFVIFFIMGFILLKGVNQREPRYLEAWKIFLAICLVAYATWRLYYLNPFSLYDSIIRLGFCMTFGIVLIAVVDTLKSQIEIEIQNPDSSDLVIDESVRNVPQIRLQSPSV